MRTRLPVRFKLAVVTAALTFGILCVFAVVIGGPPQVPQRWAQYPLCRTLSVFRRALKFG